MWWAWTPLEHCGARSVFGPGCSVCQLCVEGSENDVPSTSSRNQFPSFYPNPMPNPLSNQTQLLQLRMKAANTFLVSDDYSVAFNTLSLNMPAFLLDPLLVFLLKWRLMWWWQYYKPYIVTSHPARFPGLASFKPWRIKASAIIYTLASLNYKFSVIVDLTHLACIHVTPENWEGLKLCMKLLLHCVHEPC